MKIMKMIEKMKYSITPPCPKCPYTLGYFMCVVSPCPKCKMNGYQTYRDLVEGRYGLPKVVKS